MIFFFNRDIFRENLFLRINYINYNILRHNIRIWTKHVIQCVVLYTHAHKSAQTSSAVLISTMLINGTEQERLTPTPLKKNPSQQMHKRNQDIFLDLRNGRLLSHVRHKPWLARKSSLRLTVKKSQLLLIVHVKHLKASNKLLIITKPFKQLIVVMYRAQLFFLQLSYHKMLPVSYFHHACEASTSVFPLLN